MKTRFFRVVWALSVACLALIGAAAFSPVRDAAVVAAIVFGPLALLGFICTYIFTGSFWWPSYPVDPFVRLADITRERVDPSA